LSDLTTETKDLLMLQAKMKKLELMVELDPMIPSQVLLDGKRLQQILINLMTNAIKFTFQGSVKLAISLLSYEISDNKFKLEFKITDTGVGIKQEDLPKLFKLFGKLESSNSINKNGVGLGLSFSKNLI